MFANDKIKGQMTKPLSLYELNSLVAETISTVMPNEYWVEAELSELREVRGNCYLELVEKDRLSNTPIARASAKCWRSSWMLVRAAFERVTRQHLCAGMKVMLKVYADFHPAYGFSWIVTDINPEYTLGDMARKRQEIIDRLKTEGVFDMQHELSVPMFARRVAVVSSGGAAGYCDFCDQLSSNEHGYTFDICLFEAVMQGEAVEQSVIAALNRIYDRIESFDVVVIIRGGGATSDLSGFDTLALAENVANFPLPVITGIGHDRDESVLDMVANTRVKTPTAAAAFLIDNLAATERRIDVARDAITDNIGRRMEQERTRLTHLSSAIPVLFSVVKTKHESVLYRLSAALKNAASNIIVSQNHRIVTMADSLRNVLSQLLTGERHLLDMLAQRTSAVDPHRLLARGYSLTLHNGRTVCDPSVLQPGDRLVTLVEKGRIDSVVETAGKDKEK